MTLDPSDPPVDEPEANPLGEQKRELPNSVRWLLVIALMILLLFCCGQIAIWDPFPEGQADTRSRLSADYGPWPYIRVAVVNPAILEEIARDLPQEGVTGTPSLPQLGGPVDIWSTLGLENAPTNTPVPSTPTPTATLSVATRTPTPTSAPSATPTTTLAPTRTLLFIPTRTSTPTT